MSANLLSQIYACIILLKGYQGLIKDATGELIKYLVHTRHMICTALQMASPGPSDEYKTY